MTVLCVCFSIKTLGLGFPGNKFPLSDTVFIVSTLNLFLNSGEIPLDHDIMRECLSLCQRLPVLNTDSFKNDFLEVSSSFLVKSFQQVKYICSSFFVNIPCKPKAFFYRPCKVILLSRSYVKTLAFQC